MGLPKGLADFEGAWRISRKIEDQKGPDASFTGSAVFSPEGDGLRYRETGTLTSGGQSFAASRVYLWQPEATGIAVLFDDGRPFHWFEIAAQASAGHECAPDRYNVAYDFHAWPDWTALWQVRGPRKDYRMVSKFRRG